MSKNIKTLLLVGTIVLAAACSRAPDDATASDYVVVQPEPMSVEPAYTGKFK